MIPDEELKLIQSDIHHVSARFAGLCRRRIPKVEFEQTAWVRVLADWNKFDACKSSRRTWARRVATAGIIDAMRTSKLMSGIIRVKRPAYMSGVRAPKTCQIKPYYDALSVVDSEPLSRDDFRVTVNNLLGRELFPRQLEVLWLTYAMDMEYREVAQRLGLKPSYIPQLLSEIRKEIREKNLDISETSV